MSEQTIQLKRIQEKLQLLIREHVALQKEFARVSEALENSNEKLAGYQSTIDSLKQQVNVLKLNTGDMSDKDKKEFEKKLNHYIKEIDRCISLLGE